MHGWRWQTVTLMVVFFCVLYSSVFILSTLGNTRAMLTCLKTLRQRYSPFRCLVANLASADLLFTLLTLLNAISYFWCWVGGDVTCKVQEFLIEATYTTSITTLAVISYQRLKFYVECKKCDCSITTRWKIFVENWNQRSGFSK